MNGIEIIKQYFPTISEKELQEQITIFGTYQRISAGQKLIDFGQYVKTIPLVYKGAIKVLRQDTEGNELFLYYLNPGETCAMSLNCCMDYNKSQVKAIAEEDVELISLPAEYMDKWIPIYPSWKNFVAQTYSTRFQELLHTIDSIAFTKLDERLLNYLNAKSEATNSTIFHLTHQEIAYELSTKREVISRLLKQLEKIGKVKLGRNKIELI